MRTVFGGPLLNPSSERESSLDRIDGRAKTGVSKILVRDAESIDVSADNIG